MKRFFFLAGLMLGLAPPVQAQSLTELQALCNVHGKTAVDLYRAWRLHLNKELFYDVYMGNKTNARIYQWSLEQVYAGKFFSEQMAYSSARAYCLAEHQYLGLN